MPATIAYAPPADMSNTLMGQLGPALELTQKLQTNKLQQALMHQELEQGAQQFPLKLQAIQADLAQRQQELQFGAETMPEREKQIAANVLQTKAAVAHYQLLDDTAKQLQPYQVANAKSQSEIEATQAKYSGANQAMNLALKGSEIVGQGLSNQAQQALNAVRPQLLKTQLEGATLANQQTKEQINGLAAHLEVQKISAMGDMLTMLKSVPQASRAAVLGNLPDTDPQTFGMFKDHPEMLDDNHLKSLEEQFRSQIAQNKDLQMLMIAHQSGVDLGQKFGLVMGPDGKPTMGLTNGYAQKIFTNAWKDMVNKTTPTDQGSGGGGTTIKQPPVKQTVQQGVTPAASTAAPSKISYSANMGKINQIEGGESSLARSVYHATQQTALDARGPISGVAADPRFSSMMNTQPLSGILTDNNGFVGTDKNNPADGLKIGNADKVLFNKYMQASVGQGDTQLYDPLAKPSQVLAYRAGIDYLARAASDPVSQKVIPPSGPGGGVGITTVPNSSITPPDPFKLLLNKAYRSKLTPAQNQIMDSLAVQKGWASVQDKGNGQAVVVYDKDAAKNGVAANFSDESDE